MPGRRAGCVSSHLEAFSPLITLAVHQVRPPRRQPIPTLSSTRPLLNPQIPRKSQLFLQACGVVLDAYETVLYPYGLPPHAYKKICTARGRSRTLTASSWMPARSCDTLTKKFVAVPRRAVRIDRLVEPLSRRAARVQGGAERVRRRARGVQLFWRGPSPPRPSSPTSRPPFRERRETAKARICCSTPSLPVGWV
jgi:hypothetical protein